MISKIEEYLGDDAKYLLEYECQGVNKESLHLPVPDFVDRVMSQSDRPTSVLLRLNRELIFGG